MNRLTKKKENGFYKLTPNNEIYGEENGIRLVQIIGQLEDIEEELGIDLVTLFKALKNGANFSSPNETVMGIPFAHIVNSPHLVYDFFGQKWVLRERGGYERKVEDFGKTWFLAKEELEK